MYLTTSVNIYFYSINLWSKILQYIKTIVEENLIMWLNILFIWYILLINTFKLLKTILNIILILNLWSVKYVMFNILYIYNSFAFSFTFIICLYNIDLLRPYKTTISYIYQFIIYFIFCVQAENAKNEEAKSLKEAESSKLKLLMDQKKLLEQELMQVKRGAHVL